MCTWMSAIFLECCLCMVFIFAVVIWNNAGDQLNVVLYVKPLSDKKLKIFIFFWWLAITVQWSQLLFSKWKLNFLGGLLKTFRACSFKVFMFACSNIFNFPFSKIFVFASSNFSSWSTQNVLCLLALTYSCFPVEKILT